MDPALVMKMHTGRSLGSFVTALSLNRKVNGREQRIIVTGDADFMGSAELSRFNMRTANFYLNIALFKWLSNGEFPIDTSRPDAKGTLWNNCFRMEAHGA